MTLCEIRTAYTYTTYPNITITILVVTCIDGPLSTEIVAKYFNNMITLHVQLSTMQCCRFQLSRILRDSLCEGVTFVDVVVLIYPRY